MRSHSMRSYSMRSYLSLVPISAKVHRRQNRLTLICIILSVFLVTAIFSMMDLWLEGERNSMVRRHGNYHIVISGISEQEAEQIAGQENVAVSAWRSVQNDKLKDVAYGIGDKNLVIYSTEQAYINDIRNFETEGDYPQNETEVMLSQDAKESLGIHIGDPVNIQTPAGEIGFTVSGFCADDTEYNAQINGICAYMDAGGFGRGLAVGKDEWKSAYYIRFAKKTNLKKAIADMKAQYGLADGNVEENTATLGLASSNQLVNGLYPIGVALFLFILTSGVLMISSCINSSVSQRIQFFGMLRCIGAGKKQITHYVRMEALNWCRSAVPVGCLLGTAVTWIMCLFLKNMVGGEFAELSFRFSLLGVAFGVAVGVTTVLIAVHSPAKRAAGVSPVAAVSGNAQTRKIAHAANTRVFKVETALGIHHAVAAKKNLILMTLSFAFTVILFFSFFACLDCARKLLPSMSNFAPDVSIVSADNSTNSINKDLLDEISKISGVEHVFGNAFALDTPAEINGAGSNIDIISYESYMIDRSQKSVVSGDISKITDGSGYVMTIFNQGSSLDVGDKIKIGGAELEVACVVSEGVGGYGRPLVICTEETFWRIMGGDGYFMVNVQFNKDAGKGDGAVDAIRALAGGHEVADRREENTSNNSSYWVFRIAAYGFLAIITLITVFNIMNSISMGVTARMKIYGAMRAVGMSARQITKMIASEAVTYAASGLAIGCVVGLFLHRLIMVKIIFNHFGGHWEVPLEPVAVIVPIVVLSCVVAVRKPSKRIRDMAVTETINEL